jgi:hypothetical protein
MHYANSIELEGRWINERSLFPEDSIVKLMFFVNSLHIADKSRNA